MELELKYRTSRAVIAYRGASLIGLVIDGQDLVPPKSNQEVYLGSVLAPWQNRIKNGSYKDKAGEEHQLFCNEVERNNAHHGLVFDKEFELIEQKDDSTIFGIRFEGEEGYPFKFDLEIAYSLTESGLTVSYSAKNLDETEIPFVIGFHPYFRIGNSIDELTLTSTAKSYFERDDRGIPLQKQYLAGKTLDLRNGLSLSGVYLDDYYTDLEFVKGKSITRLTDEQENELVVWQDETLGHLVVYTTTNYPGINGETFAVAIEPASAAANAFNNGEGLRYLKPGEIFSGSWGVSFRASKQ